MPPRPLAADDDRQGFDCGRDSLTRWFRLHAWQCQQANAARTSVLRDRATRRLVGYVTLCAARIEPAHRADAQRPAPVPAVLLWQLAVDARCHGRGHSRALMQFALLTSLRLSTQLGGIGVLARPLDDGMRSFCARFGFAPAPFDAGCSMVLRMADLERSGMAGADAAGAWP